MKRILAGSALLVAVLALGGCVAHEGASSEWDAPAVSGGDGGVVEEQGSPDRVADDAIAPADRAVIVTGSAIVTVDDPLAAATEATRIVSTAGGRVDGRTEYAATPYRGASAVLELRIPADDLDPVLDDLRALGRADSVTLSSADVTVEVQDLEARIATLRASLDRLRALTAQATDIEDLIALESEVSARQAELESLEARQRYLADQVSMSTITLELRTEEAAPDARPDDFVQGLVTGWDAFVGFWATVLVALGVLAPWIVLLGVLAGATVLLVRRIRRPSA